MKKFRLIIIGLMFSATISAQMNFPSPADNPFWTELHGMLWACSTAGDYGTCDGYYCQCTTPIYYKTDTIINGTNYNRLYSRGVCNAIHAGGQPPEGCPFTFNYNNPESLYAIVRQDTLDKMVYIYEDNQESILYDFKNIIVGSYYPITYNNSNMQDSLYVVSEDSILLNNVYHKKWELGFKENGNIFNQGFVSIIEGIGSTFGIKSLLTIPFENSDQLICFSNNNNVIYPDSTFNCDKTLSINTTPVSNDINIFPNPVVDYLTINTNLSSNNKSTISIMTTTGQEIIKKEVSENEIKLNLSSLAKGFYILQIKNENIIISKKIIKQ